MGKIEFALSIAGLVALLVRLSLQKQVRNAEVIVGDRKVGSPRSPTIGTFYAFRENRGVCHTFFYQVRLIRFSYYFLVTCTVLAITFGVMGFSSAGKAAARPISLNEAKPLADIPGGSLVQLTDDGTHGFVYEATPSLVTLRGDGKIVDQVARQSSIELLIVSSKGEVIQILRIDRLFQICVYFGFLFAILCAVLAGKIEE